MKLYHHIFIVFTLVLLTYLLYNAGFGAIPFLLATIYLALITFKELKQLRKKER